MPRKIDRRQRRAQQAAASAQKSSESDAIDANNDDVNDEKDDDDVQTVEQSTSVVAENEENVSKSKDDDVVVDDDDDDDDEIQGEAIKEEEEEEKPKVTQVVEPSTAPATTPAKPTRSFADALSPVVNENKSNASSSGWSSWTSWVSSSVTAVSDIAASAIAETSKAIDSAFEDDKPAPAAASSEASALSDDNDAPKTMVMVTNEPVTSVATESPAEEEEENELDGVESLVGGFFGALESGATKLVEVTSSATKAVTSSATKALPLDSVKSTGTRVAESLTSQLNELGTRADMDKVSKAASSVMDSSFSMLERVGARAFDLLTVRETQLDQPGERVAARFAPAATSGGAPVRSSSTSAGGKSADDNKGAEFHSRFEEAMGPAHAEALERLSMHATLRTQRLLGALEAKARADATKVQQALVQLFEEDEEDEDDDVDDAKKATTSTLPAKAESVQTLLRDRVAAAKTELAAVVAQIGTTLGEDGAAAEAIVANAKQALRSTLNVGVPAMASCAALATEVLLRTGESAMVDVEPDEPMPRDDVAALRAQAQTAAQTAHALAASIQQLASEVVAAGTAVRSAARARLVALDAAAVAQQIDDAATATVKDAYLQAGRAVQHITSARQWLAPIFATLAL
jgi:hypothetical protein